MADVGWGVPFQERKRWNIKSGIATHFSQMHDLFFPHKDDWILILAGRLEHVPSHLRELQHVFLQQRLLSISIKLLWCCSRLKAGCDDQVFPPSSQVSFEQTFPQLCEESSALLPKTLAYFVFFLQNSKGSTDHISAKLWGDSPLFPFTYTYGTNPWTVLKQTSCIFRVFQISLSREDLTHFGATRTSNSNSRQRLNPGDDQVHYNLFCGTVLALGNDQQRRPWAKKSNWILR